MQLTPLPFKGLKIRKNELRMMSSSQLGSLSPLTLVSGDITLINIFAMDDSLLTEVVKQPRPKDRNMGVTYSPKPVAFTAP